MELEQEFQAGDTVRVYLEHCNVTANGTITHCTKPPEGEWLYLVTLRNECTIAVTAEDLDFVTARAR